MKIKQRRRGNMSIFDISGSLLTQDLALLERGFLHVNESDTLVLNLADVPRIHPDALKSFVRELKRRVRARGSLKLLNLPDDARELLRRTQLERLFEIYEYEDELDYLNITNGQASHSGVNVSHVQARAKNERCPNCGAALRHGAHSCFDCGATVRRRRAVRHQVSLPLLYNTTAGADLLMGHWVGGVTDDIDLERFSGVGFFTTEVFRPQQELRLIFPTIADPGAGDGVLIIFLGRIKNLLEIDDYTRVGLALFDTMEYKATWVKD